MATHTTMGLDDETSGNTTDSNATTIHKTDDLLEGTATVVLYVSIGLFGVVGNSFAIFILTGATSMRKKLVNVLLINQSAIDLAASIFLLSIGYVKSNSTVVTFFGVSAGVYCKIIATRLPLWATAVASTWNLVFVNLERYISVAFPIFHKTAITKLHISVVLAFIWLFGTGFSFCMIYLTSGFKNGKCHKEKFWPNETMALFGGFLHFTIEFLLPFSVMVLCYILMIRVIRSKIKVNITQSQNSKNENRRLSKNKNILKTLAMVTTVFVVCWLPNSVIFLNFLIGNVDSLSGILYHLSVYLLFLNSCINPIIYSAQYKDFRIQMKKVFCRNKTGSSTETTENTN